MIKKFFLGIVISLVSLPVFIAAMQVRYNAGGFPYAMHDGKIWFLLGEDPHRGNNWTDFGGKSSRSDHDDTRLTAAREFAEETNNIFGNTRAIYNTMKEEAAFGYRNKYRMYLVPVAYKNIREIKATQKSDFEKSDFIWVPADLLLDTIQNSPDDKNVFVKYGGKNIQIFNRFVWILRNFDEEIREQIGLRVKEKKQKTPLPGSAAHIQQAFITMQGRQVEVEVVSVLSFAFHQRKTLFLLGGEVRGTKVMYSDFGTLVDDSAFIKGKFDPLIPAGYAFQATSRFLFGNDTAGYMRMAIKKTGKRAFYGAHLKNMMCLAEIEYKPVDSENQPCRWFDAQDFLNWVKRNNFNIDDWDNPVMYKTFPIYQPFGAVLKDVADEVEAEINAAKNKHVAQQISASATDVLKDELMKLRNALGELNGAL